MPGPDSPGTGAGAGGPGPPGGNTFAAVIVGMRVKGAPLTPGGGPKGAPPTPGGGPGPKKIAPPTPGITVVLAVVDCVGAPKMVLVLLGL